MQRRWLAMQASLTNLARNATKQRRWRKWQEIWRRTGGSRFNGMVCPDAQALMAISDMNCAQPVRHPQLEACASVFNRFRWALHTEWMWIGQHAWDWVGLACMVLCRSKKTRL